VDEMSKATPITITMMLLATAFILVNPIDVKADSGSILYVGGSGPGNYTRIQDAIDNASDGDRIFVYSGTYYEKIVIDKSVILVGEDKNTTIIDSSHSENIVNIVCDNATISGFTIQNSDYPATTMTIKVNTSENIEISNCRIIYSDRGIELIQ